MEHKVQIEIKALGVCDHPHIVKLYEVLETPSHYYMFQEFVPNGELFEYIVGRGRISEREAREIFIQVCSRSHILESFSCRGSAGQEMHSFSMCNIELSLSKSD